MKESGEQLRIAVPTTIGLLLCKLPWIISLHFAGALGTKELAAAALATTLCNVTGMSLSVGLSTAITTLTSQARGDLLLRGVKIEQEHEGRRKNYAATMDKNAHERSTESTALLPSCEIFSDTSVQYHSIDTSMSTPLQPLVFLYRGIAIQLAFVIPIGIWWIRGVAPFLLQLGQSEELSIMTANYLRVLSLGLWCYSINWTLTCWLQAIAIVDVPAWAALIGFLSHVPFNILFVDVLGYGFLGVAAATVLFQSLQPFIICIYLFGTKQGQERVLEAIGAKAIGRDHLSFWKELHCAITSIPGIKQYLSLALPGIVIVSEWWASEVVVFLSGRLSPDPDYALGAMSIYQTINTFFFMFPVGFSAAASARVGLFLGMNNAPAARLSSNVSICFAAILSVVMGSIIMFTPHALFPSIFTADEHVVKMAASTMPFLAVYVFADGVQVALNGIVKGCGRQSIVMPIVIFAYWVVGVPLAYYDSFERHSGTTFCEIGEYTCGVRGLVFAMTTATWIHFLLLLGVVIWAINWEEEVKLAQDRINRSHKHK
eukprot:scaffold3357_cov268-Chaetoceros_neogracile.AAC.11